MKELISIIVPVYNTEAYLQECIQSVLKQTYRHWELLLVDDGSTDKSGEICESYAADDNRIKVFHQNNAGQSKARNTALEFCEGISLWRSGHVNCPAFPSWMHRCVPASRSLVGRSEAP